MNILFFIETLHAGGKERRLVELITYLKNKTDYQIQLVLAEHDIHYDSVTNLNIDIYFLTRNRIRRDPSLFFKFYQIVKKCNPDIIHTWGTMSTFYSIPSKLILNKKLIANLITNAKRNYNTISLMSLFNSINFLFSNLIIGNSLAGLKAYNLETNEKVKLIYNGVSKDRFPQNIDTIHIKKKLNIATKHVITMVASASKNKDYDLLLDVAKITYLLNSDITFLCVGNGTELERLENRRLDESIKNTIFLGKRNDIEELIAISDICLLLSQSEGISNAIIEYMAMGKPVITTDLSGGSRELIINEKTGFIMQPIDQQISKKIIELINTPDLMKSLGQEGQHVINQKFSIERMGKEYINLYSKYNSLNDF
ncbi:MAG: glycosyltransferase [Kiritimatiellia bacterium]|nr:glycosyltransferase [Bacteroidales bacterium]